MLELSKLEFLLGRWEGSSVDQFGEKGTIVSTLECTHEPSELFLQLSGENRKNGKLVNRAVQFLTFDSRIKKYIYKRMWSMGFIENGVGQWEDDDTLMFEIEFDNEPEFFLGMRWKSFIRCYGQNEIGHGLYCANKGEEYRLYGETHEFRAKSRD